MRGMPQNKGEALTQTWVLAKGEAGYSSEEAEEREHELGLAGAWGLGKTVTDEGYMAGKPRGLTD